MEKEELFAADIDVRIWRCHPNLERPNGIARVTEFVHSLHKFVSSHADFGFVSL